jgi:hypothetical protein
MTAPSSNPLPALDAATEAALRESIERFGVRVAILIDQHGEIVDGRHRHRIATELGVPCPAESTRMPDDPEQRAELLASINDARRQRLSVDERREVVAVLRAQGHSLRAIAGATGVSKSQVAEDVAQLSSGGQLPAIADGNGDSGGMAVVHQLPVPAAIIGLDGRRRPATQKRSKIVRPAGSPSWALMLTSDLRKLAKSVAEAREWRDRGHNLPPETLERLGSTRDGAAQLLRDLDGFLGRAAWGERPKDGEPIAVAYLRRAVEILAATSDVPRSEIEACRGHLNALDAQLRRLLDVDDA